MAHIIKLKTFKDSRGSLTVIEDEIPFAVKRIFYIRNSFTVARAGHRHKKNIMALVCLNGTCHVKNNNGKEQEIFKLSNSNECLILQPEDWHLLQLNPNGILLVLCSELYDENDYIFKKYEQSTNN